MITDYKTLSQQIEINQLVTIHVAHKFEHGYWKCYSQTRYRAVIIATSKIVFQNESHPNEYLELDNDNLKSGQFKVEFDTYKGDKITTNGLSEQHVFEIKEKWHSGWGAGYIAHEMGLTTEQVLYAINLNEVSTNDFTVDDFS